MLDSGLRAPAVLIAEVDLADPEALQARVTARADRLGTTIDADKLAVVIADAAELGRHNHRVAAPLDRLTHEPFLGAAAIHVGGVRKVDAGFQRDGDGPATDC